jgi:hypothetical protein
MIHRVGMVSLKQHFWRFISERASSLKIVASSVIVCKPKIHEPRSSLKVNDDVFRLDITMYDPFLMNEL